MTAETATPSGWDGDRRRQWECEQHGHSYGVRVSSGVFRGEPDLLRCGHCGRQWRVIPIRSADDETGQAEH
ncbi:MAG: hypothetical protein ACLPVF_17905 [Acidimicrobiales bacterium]